MDVSSKRMTTERHIKLGRQTALISFLLGTAIFGLYFLTSSFELLLLGYGFIALTGLLNVGVLISILVKANTDKDNRTKLFTTCGLMLLNIPVMLFYCLVTIILLNTMRITFTNSTQTCLTNINIVGCGGGHIDKLESGESETVWVNITGDCSLNIEYLSNEQKKEENVTGYVTSSMGRKIKHNIGGQNEELF
ncbi:MAG: hypothetical protein K2Q03_09440 [Sphingobacteriaceae bacterium]|nr:hypothetical protein [Sphingobacteriaceae bacterium]